MEDDNAVSVEDKDENKENIVKETKFDLSATQVIEDENKPVQPLGDSRPVSRRVEIERIKSGYSERSHNESNLPNVLNEYGLSSADERLRGYHKDKKKKKKAADKGSHHDEESREKLRKKRDERYQLMMSELQNQSDISSQFFSRRVSGIMERVDKQQKGELSPRKPSTADTVDGKRPERNKFKKKLERHELKHDASFLREIPKTDMAKIVELQEKLMREGKLKTQGERDKFWEDMRKPEVFNSNFKNNNKFAEGLSTVHSHNRNVHQSNVADNTNKGTRDGWAVTQQVQHKYDPNKEIVVNTKSNLSAGQLAKQAAADLEKRFPKLAMPPLKSLTIELGEKPPDPEELIREAELKAKIKQRKMFLRKLTRMHQMAMTHSAAAARIMDKHDDEINQLMDGKTLRDVISVFPQREEDAYITEEDIGYKPIDFNNLPGKSQGSRQSSAKSRSSQHSAYSKKSSKSAPKLLNRRESFTEEKNAVSSKPLPLTLDEIRNKNKIIEAKCLSTFWVNYAKTDTVPGVVAQ